MSHSDKSKKKRQKAFKKLNKETGGGKSFDEARAKKKKEKKEKRDVIAAKQATEQRFRSETGGAPANVTQKVAAVGRQADEVAEVTEQTPEEKNAILEAQIADQQRRNQADQDRDRARATAQGLTVEELEAQAGVAGVTGLGKAGAPAGFDPETGTTDPALGGERAPDLAPPLPKTPADRLATELFGPEFMFLGGIFDEQKLQFMSDFATTDEDPLIRVFSRDATAQAALLDAVDQGLITAERAQEIADGVRSQFGEAAWLVGVEPTKPFHAGGAAEPFSPDTSFIDTTEPEAETPPVVEVEPTDTAVEPRQSTFELTPKMHAQISNPSDVGAKTGELIAAFTGGNPKMVTEALRTFDFPIPDGVFWDGERFDTSELAGLEPEGLSDWIALMTPMFQLRDMVRGAQGVNLTAEQQLTRDEFLHDADVVIQGMKDTTALALEETRVAVELARLQAQIDEGGLDRQQRALLEDQRVGLQRDLEAQRTNLAIGLQTQRLDFEASLVKFKADIEFDKLERERELFKIDAPLPVKEIKEKVAGLTGQGASLLAGAYTTKKFAKIQEWAAQVGSLELPAGVIWNDNTGDFVLRAGFDGRQITPEAAQYMASVRGVFQMRANALAMAEVEETTRSNIRAHEDERIRLERSFNDSLARGEITSAEQQLALQRNEAALLDREERRLMPIELGMKLFQNPVMLGLAQFYGFTDALEQELGFKFPANSFGTSGAKSAKEIGIVDFLKADEATRAIMQASFSAETGQGPQEFMRGLAGQLPAQARRQTNVGVV